MFDKKASTSLGRFSIEALNRPSGWEEFEGEQELSISRIKLASVEKADGVDLDGFDITAAIEKNPDHLFVKVLAIKKDEVNDNGDAFCEEELKKAAETFIGVPVFCNHQNDDIEKARGKVVHAWYDEDKGGIYTINMVDKMAYPKLARGIEEGYIVGTSMGCQVHHSCCSICHNMAHTADEYCDHVKNRKTKKFSGKVKCSYHKSKCKPDRDCPVCSCEKGAESEHTYKDAQIYEHNFGLKFIEDSFVVNPACHDCLVDCVLNVPEFSKKVAAIYGRLSKFAGISVEPMEKVASVAGMIDLAPLKHTVEIMKVHSMIRKVAKDHADAEYKVAGQMEVEYLNKAMKLMSVVAKSMLDQKEVVSMDYLADITGVLSDLQKATDELVEMGYATVQSPPTLENPEMVGDAVAPPPDQGQQQQQSQMPQMPAAPAGGASSSPNGIGSVTKPTFSPSASGNMKELTKEGSKLTDKVAESGEQLNQNHKESATMADKNTKIAAGEGVTSDQHQVTTQKQLEEWSKKDVLHGRTGEAPDGVTESDQQLGLKTEPVNDTTSQSPQVRQDKYPDETMEGQLARPVFGDGFIKWDAAPDVITEKTWTDFTRSVGAVLSEDQKEHTTQAQLEDLRSHHRWTEPDYTTESQLASDKNWRNTDNAWLSKEAAADYSKRLVTSAIEALSDAVAFYQRTPAEIVKAANFITKDPASHIKAAFITLVNGIPANRATRKAEIERSRYFGKVSVSGTPAELLLACMGNHCVNLKAEDFVDAVRYVASEPSRMAAVEELAKKKASASTSAPVDEAVDKYAAFASAFEEITNPDGMYEVRAAIEDVGDLSDESGFVAAAERFGRSQIKSASAVLYSVEADPDGGAVYIQFKEAAKLTAEEKAALASPKEAKSRDQLVKEAQMMGGQMGGQGGAAAGPGAGASLPAPPAGGPGAGAPPMESMDAPPGGEDPMGGEEGGDKEAKPPGSICPVCGSEDVDIVEGKGKCNNCNSQFVFKVQVEVTRWTGVNDKNSGDEGGEGEDGLPDLGGDQGGMGGEEGGEGFPMPEGGETTPNIPVAATFRFTPGQLMKLAKSDVRMGTVSPYTGSTNTMHVAGIEHFCLDTGKKYEVDTRVSKSDPKGDMWVEWRWTSTPKIASACSSCRRSKKAFTKVLKSAGIAEADFDAMSFKKKADTIIDLHKNGKFALVKTASKNSSVLGEFKQAFSVTAGKFPTESCREKLARRYGETALAISGPCKGEKIYDCVCNQLKKANVYSDKIAIKIADTWKDKDACLECMEDYVRIGYELTTAATVCQHLKVKYASPEEMLADDMTDQAPVDDGMGGGMGGDPAGDPMGGGMDEQDPFGDQGGDGFESGGLDGDPAAGGDPMAGDPSGDPTGEVSMDDGAMDISAPAPEMGLPGGAGDSITIEIPVDTVKQMVLDKLAPGAGAGQELGAGPVDVPLGGGLGDELGGIAEQAIDGLAGGAGNGEEVALDVEPDGGEGEEPLGGGDGDGDDDGGPGGSPFGGGDEDSSGNGEGESSGFGEGEGADNKEPSVDHEIKDSGEEEGGMSKSEFASAHNLAQQMKKGKRVGQIDLDLSAVQALLKKQAGEVEPTVEKSQDVVDKYKDGKTIGHEQKFDPSKPSVPRATATIGAEESDRNPKDKPLPKVPAGGGEIGHEKELGYTSDKPNMSGGDSGAGKTDLAKSKASPKTAAQAKTAGEKKIAPKEPVSEVTEVDYSANKDLSSTPDHLKRTPFAESDNKEVENIPEKGEGAFIGDEKTSIEFVPKSPENHPSIPAGGGRNPKYDKNEKLTPEHLEKIKGTVIANDEKSHEVKKEATRLAVEMAKAEMIDATEVMDKVAQLQRYTLSDLKLLENSLFKGAAKKGLATAPDGLEGSPVVISAESNERSSQGDLKTQLQSLFKLDRQNKLASESTDADLRNQHNRK